MFISRASLLLTGMALAGVFGAAAASAADALYFEKVDVKTGSEATCLRFASDVARQNGFTDVHKSASEVAGRTNNAYVAITCVGRGNQPAIAVIMSVAPSFETAKAAGHAAANKIKGIICFDTPC